MPVAPPRRHGDHDHHGREGDQGNEREQDAPPLAGAPAGPPGEPSTGRSLADLRRRARRASALADGYAPAMRGLASVLAAAAALTVVISLGAGAERAAHGHEGLDCGIVSDGPRDYRVRAQQLNSTRRAADEAIPAKRRGAHRILCDEPAGRIEFFCKNGSKFYWAVRL